MRTGCYHLLLGCDCGPTGDPFHCEEWDYTGPTGANCRAQARRDGWKPPS